MSLLMIYMITTVVTVVFCLAFIWADHRDVFGLRAEPADNWLMLIVAFVPVLQLIVLQGVIAFFFREYLYKDHTK